MEPADGFFSDMHGLYNQMLPSFVERFGRLVDPEEMEIIVGLGKARNAPLFQPVGRPFCLEHRDYRPDNLMIDTTGAAPRVIAVDWQGMRTGRPLNDVALCLAGSLEPDTRRAVERDILREYHDALVRAGVADFGFEQCWTEYRRAAFAGFGLTVVAAMTVVQTPRGDRMFAAMAHRYARHALEVDAREFMVA
jgi:aminoglycoside phosphotransferase (APT) family kinase protein